MTLEAFLDYLYEHGQTRELSIALYDVLVQRGAPARRLLTRAGHVAAAG